MMRQSANSAIRFTTYTGLKQLVQGQARPGQALPASVTFGIGAFAGLVTVYTTMPLECVFALRGLMRHAGVRDLSLTRLRCFCTA
jgi:hypothetical protein